MSVADNADWGQTVKVAVCERWPLKHVAGDDSEPDWFDARFVAPLETEHISAVAPPDGLLNAYKAVVEATAENGEPNPAAIAWNSVDFERRYHEHLDRTKPETVIRELADRARERDVWLVCWEKDAQWCHRRLLANAVVDQLEDTEVVHHPDPSTIPVDTSDDESADDPDATLADFAEGRGA